MSIRKVKQYSDRGKIKDLASRRVAESEAELLPSDQRLKRLYEYAKLHNDHGILGALAFITTEYVEDKNALPLTAYRLREMVANISKKSEDKICQLKIQLDECFGDELSSEAISYINCRKLIKTASVRSPIFRRVRKP
jgi:hypothetical protein